MKGNVEWLDMMVMLKPFWPYYRSDPFWSNAKKKKRHSYHQYYHHHHLVSTILPQRHNTCVTFWPKVCHQNTIITTTIKTHSISDELKKKKRDRYIRLEIEIDIMVITTN